MGGGERVEGKRRLSADGDRIFTGAELFDGLTLDICCIVVTMFDAEEAALGDEDEMD